MGEHRDRNRRIERLRRIPLLAGCSATELTQIDRLGAQVDVREGTRLTSEGGASRECFVVLDGTAVVHCEGRAVGTVGAGSVVGEIGPLHRTARTATVVAASPMRLLVLSAPELDELVRVAPQVAARLEALAAERRARLDAARAA